MATRGNTKSFEDLKLLPIDKAAARYHCSVRTLTRAIENNMVDAYKPGSTRMIDLETGDAWFMDNKHKARRRGRRKR